MLKKKPPTNFTELPELLNLLKRNPQILDSLPADLFTNKERKELGKRWQIIKLLHAEVPHHKIAAKLNVGVATVTRGAKMLKNPTGAFNQLLKIYDK